MQTGFGLSKIEVRDNGCGIKKDQVKFAAKPHFTSKLSNTNDLSHLETYGFRGEALGTHNSHEHANHHGLLECDCLSGCLCAVSDLTITTRTKSCDVGFAYEIDHHGDITSAKVSHFPQGSIKFQFIKYSAQTE